MKKIISIVLLICVLLLCFTACDDNGASSENEVEAEPITLTKDNFKDYFTIDVITNCTIHENGGNVVLGVYIPTYYTADASVDVDVFASTPLDAYNVVVTLEITTGYVYWNSKTITLNISSSGDAARRLNITTNTDRKEFLLYERDVEKDFYARIISVEGSVKTK